MRPTDEPRRQSRACAGGDPAQLCHVLWASRRKWQGESDKLQSHIKGELEMLWDDLIRARRDAINGDWSIACDNLGVRIHEATALAGPVSWRNIGMTTLVSGEFAKLASRIGADVVLPTDEELAQLKTRIKPVSGE